MNRGDELIERAADWFEERSRAAAAEGGSKAKLADLLADDAVFLRKLKPSLIAARARGELPTDERPATVHATAVATPPSTAGPRETERRPRNRARANRGGGPNPFVVIGAALFAGILLAKIIDWRGHAYPRA